MRGNISAWAIRQPIPSIVLFIILTVVGIVSFASMSITDSPNVDLPLVSVTVTQSGAAPEELETQVTRLVEDAVANLGRIKEITSTVTDGTSETDVEFTLGTNTDRAVNDVRDAISKIRSDLPGSIDDPQVERVDATGDAVVAYAVSIPGYSPAKLGWFVDNDMARAMSTVKGVAALKRWGGAEREIRVNLDPARLVALGISVNDVNTQIRQVNTNMPGGRSTLGTTEQSIRTLGVDRDGRTAAQPHHHAAGGGQHDRDGGADPNRAADRPRLRSRTAMPISAAPRASTASRSWCSPCCARPAKARSMSPRASNAAWKR